MFDPNSPADLVKRAEGRVFGFFSDELRAALERVVAAASDEETVDALVAIAELVRRPAAELG